MVNRRGHPGFLLTCHEAIGGEAIGSSRKSCFSVCCILHFLMALFLKSHSPPTAFCVANLTDTIRFLHHPLGHARQPHISLPSRGLSLVVVLSPVWRDVLFLPRGGRRKGSAQGTGT